MKILRYLLTTFLLLTAHVSATYSQNLSLKNNLFYDATATPNAALEARLTGKWTLDASVGWNPFTFSDNKKLKHVAVQLEPRYWLCTTMAGHFVGFNVLYSHYNAGGVYFPFGLFRDLRTQRFQGDLGAVGLVYGYSWMLPGRHWSVEAVAGLGYGLTHYTRYACERCGSKIGSDTRGLFMPTKLALNLVYHLR